ncbi:fatty acyl-AMP ligase [Tengunoibacter tsumagoiensis]|uniref:Acyl-CoA synthetase n=1 Tax=Tengunoibacter tsumagoiensis TaxID=2014871 RepID=A0A402AA44_9CHLR|nr:fatty acyl-AMP ligase [Tengunoibacter tsumagoiensis]GCE15771.1 acyl-CoA synthetase [Tengunoibacter tsumagoiensis]
MTTDLPVQMVKTSTLVELLRGRAYSQPTQIAYSFFLRGDQDEEEITYAELDQRARIIAGCLQQLKAEGKRALLLYPPGLEYIAAFFGCLYAGVTAIPSYPPNSERLLPRIVAIVENAEAEIILASSSQLTAIQRWFTNVPSLKRLHWLTTDTLSPSLASTWREPAIGPDTLAFLQYTSGSTSLPKGVMLTHKNLLHNLKLIEYGMDGVHHTQGFFWLPPYHDMGLIGGILQPFYAGFPAALMSPVAFLQRPLRWLQIISRKQVTVSGAPNFAYDLCVRKVTPEQRAQLDLSSWRVAFCGAEPIRAETIELFTETFASCGFKPEAFYPTYGLAETSLMASGGHMNERPIIRTFRSTDLEQNRVVPGPIEFYNTASHVSCGRTLLDLRIVIADPITREQCPGDRVGEIWLQGESVSQGYWAKPEETAQTFGGYLSNGDGPFLRTGDLGFLWHGELFVTGRIKDVIIIRGHNHYPQDIEFTVEESHSALRASGSAAFSVDVQGKEQLVIVAEVDPHFRPARQGEEQNTSSRKPLSAEEVTNAIRQAISENHDLQAYQIQLVKPGGVPKTSSGKLQRRACRELFLTESLGKWDE